MVVAPDDIRFLRKVNSITLLRLLPKAGWYISVASKTQRVRMLSKPPIFPLIKISYLFISGLNRTK